MSFVFTGGENSAHPVRWDWDLVDGQIRGLEGRKSRMKGIWPLVNGGIVLLCQLQQNQHNGLAQSFCAVSGAEGGKIGSGGRISTVPSVPQSLRVK
jgi:hypothetical protein